MSGTQVLLFSSGVGAVVDAFGVVVAVREKREGSAWWAWLLPGAFGGLLLALSLLKLVVAAA